MIYRKQAEQWVEGRIEPLIEEAMEMVVTRESDDYDEEIWDLLKKLKEIATVERQELLRAVKERNDLQMALDVTLGDLEDLQEEYDSLASEILVHEDL